MITISKDKIVMSSGNKATTITNILDTFVDKDSKFIVFTHESGTTTVRLNETAYTDMDDMIAALGEYSYDSEVLDLGVSTVSSVYKSRGSITFEVQSDDVSATVTVLMSVSGSYWATAKTADGEDITGELSSGSTPLVIPLYDVTEGTSFKLSFSDNSGGDIVNIAVK